MWLSSLRVGGPPTKPAGVHISLVRLPPGPGRMQQLLYTLQVFKAELAGRGAVAVKVLRKHSVDEARLWREAEIMHSCRHPSILEVGICTLCHERFCCIL